MFEALTTSLVNSLCKPGPSENSTDVTLTSMTGRVGIYYNIILMAGNLRKDARRLDSDKMRFSIASNPYHVLRRLYNEKEACGYNLRTRPHYNFALPVKDDTNFVSRSLYAELKS